MFSTQTFNGHELTPKRDEQMHRSFILGAIFPSQKANIIPNSRGQWIKKITTTAHIIIEELCCLHTLFFLAFTYHPLQISMPSGIIIFLLFQDFCEMSSQELFFIWSFI